MNQYRVTNDSSILITGGTGSFGKSFTSNILENFPNIKRLVVFSRDELKQYQMEQKFSRKNFPGLRYFLGDIRDHGRLVQALRGIDIVIHAAALKHVPIAEYNPFEFINTNILGSQNIIQASLENGVKKVIALSTDKAAAPINLYGATKLCSDKLFIAANNIIGKLETSFSVVRYGNVMGSRGSVIPYFLKIRESGSIPITSPEMTRFNITLNQSVDMVRHVIENSMGGEIFIPKIPSYRILDLAEAVAPNAEIKIVGVRPGEKIHEEMVTSSDSLNTIDVGDYYIILPNFDDNVFDNSSNFHTGNRVKEGFSYNSRDNLNFLSVSELREMINLNENSLEK